MKTIVVSIFFSLGLLLWANPGKAQIKNSKTAVVKIYGNCGMCKSTIEKAANVDKLAKVNWDRETKKATVTYDAKRTNTDEILKRVALAGYDNEAYIAPDEAYTRLHQCCLYERADKNSAKPVTVPADQPSHKQ